MSYIQPGSNGIIINCILKDLKKPQATVGIIIEWAVGK